MVALIGAATACGAGDRTTDATPTAASTTGATVAVNDQDVVVVTIGTEEHDDGVAAQLLGLMSDEVDRVSGGAVRLDISYSVIGALGGGVAWDQHAIQLAADGTFDGVVARAGAWHQSGVTSLDVLQLPGLIDSDRQADRFSADADAVDAVLAGLGATGFSGLGVYAEGPRYLMLLDDTTDFSAAALAGRTVRAPLSETVFDVLSSLGMTPVDLTAADFTVQVPEGTVTATEGHLARVAVTTTIDGDSDAVVAINLPLFTKFLVLAVRTDAVSPEVMTVLQTAARNIVHDFTTVRPDEAAQLDDACAAGGVLVQLTEPNRKELSGLMAPVAAAFAASKDGGLIDVVAGAAGPPDLTLWRCP